MSKKHFKAFAEAIACIIDTEDRARTAWLVANICAGENGRFDYNRFYAACNVERP
jgi:hypothetical protein